MKKIVPLLFAMPLTFSCSKLYSVKKEKALQTINELIEKYKTIDNVELNAIISENINNDKYQFAYDSKNKIFYEYRKSINATEKTWKYFDNDTLITLDELETDGIATKLKYKNSSISPIGEQYFKLEIKKIIDKNIEQLSSMLKIDKKKEEYLTHGSDLIININYDQYTNSVIIENNKLVSSSYKRYDGNNKVISFSEYTFGYDSFITTVNPNDFIEVNYGNN